LLIAAKGLFDGPRRRLQTAPAKDRAPAPYPEPRRRGS